MPDESSTVAANAFSNRRLSGRASGCGGRSALQRIDMSIESASGTAKTEMARRSVSNSALTPSTHDSKCSSRAKKPVSTTRRTYSCGKPRIICTLERRYARVFAEFCGSVRVCTAPKPPRARLARWAGACGCGGAWLSLSLSVAREGSVGAVWARRRRTRASAPPLREERETEKRKRQEEMRRRRKGGEGEGEGEEGKGKRRDSEREGAQGEKQRKTEGERGVSSSERWFSSGAFQMAQTRNERRANGAGRGGDGKIFTL
eukprot:scaffold122034_cov32-Tisochrysis_lutea.AAC.4